MTRPPRWIVLTPAQVLEMTVEEYARLRARSYVNTRPVPRPRRSE